MQPTHPPTHPTAHLCIDAYIHFVVQHCYPLLQSTYTSEERPVSRYRRYITVMTILRMTQL